MEQRPEDIVAVAIVVLMDDLFIKKDWNASLEERGKLTFLEENKI